MKLRSAPLQIPRDDPFRHDVLDRRAMVESLTAIVSNVAPPLTLCIDSQWGGGKTTFLRLWEASLAESTSVRVLYFNAWATDFAADPLVAFVADITALAQAIDPSSTATASGVKLLKKLGTQIARRAIPVAARIATAGLLDTDELIEDAAGGLAETLAGDLIKAYEKEKQLIANFREALTDLIEHLSLDGRQARLLILVDELDRCRPPYALELLERVKHLFDVPNVVFALALDRRQLGASIEAVYGSRFDSAEYLRRFIDLEFSLPKPKPEAFTDYLFGQFNLDEAFKKRSHQEFQYDPDHTKAMFNALANVFDLSLRAREHCFARLRIAMLALKDNEYMYPDVLIALIMLRIAAKDVYERYTTSGSVTDVTDCLRSRPGGAAFLASDHPGTLLEAFLIAAKGSTLVHGAEAPELQAYRRLADEQIQPDDDDAAKAKKQRAQKIVEFIADMRRGRNRVPPLQYMLSKIEIGVSAR